MLANWSKKKKIVVGVSILSAVGLFLFLRNRQKANVVTTKIMMDKARAVGNIPSVSSIQQNQANYQVATLTG